VRLRLVEARWSANWSTSTPSELGRADSVGGIVDGIVTVVYADIMEIMVEIHVCVLEYEKVRRAILYQEAGEASRQRVICIWRALCDYSTGLVT
jgi:hypothetical protein